MQTQSQSSTLFARLFTEHPATVNETYLEHAGVAGRFAFWLAVAACAALAHAVIPRVCETTASRIIRRLHAQMEARH
ncbi:MAG: DUF6356 family protein [Pseudomonadota bacterium]